MMDIGLGMLETIDYNMVLNVCMVLGMGALWYLWWQQYKHRQTIESSLIEAASQLEEASMLLDEALKQIAEIKDHEHAARERLKVKKESEDTLHDDGVHVQISSQAKAISRKKKLRASAHHQKRQRVMDTSQDTSQSTQTAQILRMQREGEKAEDIAMQLDIPLAQVKLMLMLQGA